MPKPISINGRVSADGTPSGALERNIQGALRLWPDGDVKVTVASRDRSNSANGYYWAVVVDEVWRFFVSRGFAVEVQDTHDTLKRWFLPARVIEVPSADGLDVVETITVYGSTRTDSFTFAEYVNKIRDHEPFARAGLYIPEPNEKVTGRTIHEPGGGKVTFRDPKTPAPEPEPLRRPAPDRAPAPVVSRVVTFADLYTVGG